MASKVQSTAVNSSNGFKKRLLRPVSNRPTEPTNLMKNSRILNLRNSLSVKNKYANVKTLVNSLADELQTHFHKIQHQVLIQSEQPNSKGLQYVKSKALSLKLRKEQMSKSLTSSNETLVKQNGIKLPWNEKSVSKILSQLQTQNLQDGIQLLYNEQSESTQIIENLCGIMSMANLIKVNWKNDKDLQVFEKFDGDEENLEYLVKMLGIRLGEKEDNQIQILQTTQSQQKPKFRQIFTAKDEESDSQQKQKFKQQIIELKQTISCLQNQIHEFQTLRKTEPACSMSKNLQNAHKQIQMIYDQAIKLRNSQIQKLRNQLTQAQQAIAKQFTINDLMSQGDRKCTKGTTIFTDIPANADSKQFTYTVQEQFEKMRAGFMKKMEKLQLQFNDREQKMKKQLFHLEKTVEGLEWEKKIILKKYQFLLYEDTIK